MSDTVKSRPRTVIATAIAASLLLATTVFAQTPTPDDFWSGTAGVGAALTSGNSDTLNVNLAADVTYDPKTKNVVKANGLYLRGEENDELAVDRLSLGLRDQYALGERLYTFGQIDYLRDTFKAIDALVAPTAGLGYRFANSEITKFAVDGGVGAIWEKNPGFETRTSVALTLGERLEHALTPAATVKHAATALWAADDFDAGLYTASIGLGAAISPRWRLTVDLLDTFKNRPPTPETKQNDVALVTAVTAKF